LKIVSLYQLYRHCCFPCGSEIPSIDELDHNPWEHNGAGLVKAAVRQIIQPFVRPLVIEHLPEPVELCLLLPHCQGYRVRFVLLEGADGLKR
jgi:hypothetical protein